jgi:hypothetical protein
LQPAIRKSQTRAFQLSKRGFSGYQKDVFSLPSGLFLLIIWLPHALERPDGKEMVGQWTGKISVSPQKMLLLKKNFLQAATSLQCPGISGTDL